MNKKYENILNHKRHYSLSHPKMSNEKRAAQFAPFAALTGFEDKANETARQTQQRIIIDENEIDLINNKLKLIEFKLNEQPTVKITYFEKDAFKEGGKYITAAGCVQSIDLLNSNILMSDGTKVPVNDIIDIDGDIFTVEDNSII